ncbi:hypothetical protein Hanom_Chr14g01258801 [Helianthus anomalus]
MYGSFTELYIQPRVRNPLYQISTETSRTARHFQSGFSIDYQSQGIIINLKP